MKSLAHPDWPYSGTPWEWRGFAENKETEKPCLIDIKGLMDRQLHRAATYQKQNFGPELK
jgi:hypothetical protein